MPPAQHRHNKTRTTSIIVKQTTAIKSGRSRNGDAYTLYQVIATKPDGTPIEDAQGNPLNLRTFDELPRDEVVKVAVTPFTSDQYGTSYTLKREGVSKLEKEVQSLRERVAQLERHLGLQAPGAPPPPPSTQLPPLEVPNGPPTAGGGGGDSNVDDIPF